MTNNDIVTGSPANWLVSSSVKKSGDQTARFLTEGIWENPSEHKDVELVRTMRRGDRIALKSMYEPDVKPFDSRGRKCMALSILATGTITENFNDGRRVRVAWNPTRPPRDWYFYTSTLPIWQVKGGEPSADALLAFTFKDVPQDINWFRNDPFWRSRFGDAVEPKSPNFDWTRFYEAMAERLLQFRDDRPRLIAGIHEIASRVNGMSHLQDRFPDGSTGPLKDIDPFTALGVFNRSLTDANRKIIANAFAFFLGVDEPAPDHFDGIPVLNNQNSWFFGFATKRKHDDIDALWDVFAAAKRYVSSDEAEAEPSFLAAYDAAIARYGVAWNLSSGLYLAHPWDFVSLDSCARNYIENSLDIPIASQRTIDASTYLKLKATLENHFGETIYPVHSYPELSLAAWRYRSSPNITTEHIANRLDESAMQSIDATITNLSTNPVRFEPYSVDDIIEDGCFLDRLQLEKMLLRLRAKKNVILQGAPGTGKTWLARRLAFALVGQKNESRVRAVQFHPNLSYEDFVRGWRPNGDGRLSLEDGIFMESIRCALMEPSLPFVVVIEEINRGNPAQIFGELLTLLEADKRTPNEALELCYRRSDEERVFIPSNLYVIGTMNVADRSLALVDLALRRRFAFFDLEPRMDDTWRKWVVNHCGVQPALANEVARRMGALNEGIGSDLNLGKHYRIGHSFVTPPVGGVAVTAEWFKDVFESEIGPLLEEYWFDSSAKASAARQKLIEGL